MLVVVGVSVFAQSLHNDVTILHNNFWVAPRFLSGFPTLTLDTFRGDQHSWRSSSEDFLAQYNANLFHSHHQSCGGGSASWTNGRTDSASNSLFKWKISRSWNGTVYSMWPDRSTFAPNSIVTYSFMIWLAYAISTSVILKNQTFCISILVFVKSRKYSKLSKIC